MGQCLVVGSLPIGQAECFELRSRSPAILLGPTERDRTEAQGHRPHPPPSRAHRGLLGSRIRKQVAARANTTSRVGEGEKERREIATWPPVSQGRIPGRAQPLGFEASESWGCPPQGRESGRGKHGRCHVWRSANLSRTRCSRVSRAWLAWHDRSRGHKAGLPCCRHPSPRMPSPGAGRQG